MTDKKPAKGVNIIRHRGEPQKAEFEGVPIYRREKLFVREWGGLVPCTPYDDHFVFAVPPGRVKPGMSEYMCTCGAAAVVANPEVQETRLFVCMMHATYGYHSTHYINKKDFEGKDLGETIDTTGKRWLI